VEATGDIKRPFGMSRTVSPPLLAVQAFPPLLEEVQKIAAQIAAKIAVVASRTETIALGELPRLWMRYTLARRPYPACRHQRDRPRALRRAGRSGRRARRVPMREPRSYLRRPREPWPASQRCSRSSTAPSGGRAGSPSCDAYGRREEGLRDRRSLPRQPATAGARREGRDERRSSSPGSRRRARRASGESQLHVQRARRADQDLPGMPSDVAGPPGAEYFKVDPHGDRWAKVRDEFSFAVSLGPLADADVRLFIVAGG
jgi:hypothetical protein